MPADSQEAPTEFEPTYDVGTLEEITPFNCNNFLSRTVSTRADTRRAAMDILSEAEKAAYRAHQNDLVKFADRTTAMSTQDFADRATATVVYIKKRQNTIGRLGEWQERRRAAEDKWLDGRGKGRSAAEKASDTALYTAIIDKIKEEEDTHMNSKVSFYIDEYPDEQGLSS